ncbi:DUF418 domain-containing protein [Carboxylicivirga sp. N1Y90]|uniref:DUF418 domain-containing protein n=1 Tax=Carboxylicivirga fragile TaxID=3417571 RepID=UPI003D33E180|nr:DUF418 domain-containing protein [Marinilabiliaceae bacterium N1Y90]
MVQNKSISSPLKRITILDSLRGFALLGVILMHMIQHFGIFSTPSQNEVHRFPELDQAVQWIGNNIIMGRFINIFALLFGLSFFIQMDRAAKKGIDFRMRFVWRMILLLVMGLISHSFYSVEIISVYGFLGLLMLPLYRFKSWMLITIVAFLLLGGPRVIKAFNHNKSVKTEQVETREQMNNTQASRAVPEHLANPSFLNIAKFNYQERLPGKLNYQFGFIGRGYITFALFILGLLLGRNRFFENEHKHKKRNMFLFIGFVLATILFTWVQKLFPPLNIFIFFRPEGQILASETLIVKTLEDISLVLFTGSLIMGFILLYNTRKFGIFLEVLAPYGRTALTNYIMQGVIGSFIFSVWAFGSIFSNWGVSALFILGIVIYIVQIICSKIWLNYFIYGPLEWLWRSLTYFEIQPFRKKITL